jgi:hypothetical protein
MTVSLRQPMDSDDAGYVAEIVVEPDGTVSFQHLDPELLQVALALSPTDPRLLRMAGMIEDEA